MAAPIRLPLTPPQPLAPVARPSFTWNPNGDTPRRRHVKRGKACVSRPELQKILPGGPFRFPQALRGTDQDTACTVESLSCC